MVNINDLMITGVETITAFDIATGAFKWVLDELQSAKIANTQEKTDITGKQGRKLGSLKKNKAVVVSGTNGLISSGLLETQTGGALENKSTSILYPEYLTVSENHTATTTYKAAGAQGNEIDTIFVHNANGTLGAEYTQSTTAAKGKFTYDPATKTITFSAEDNLAGSEIAVYYFRNVTAPVLDNMSDTYSEKVALYIDAFAEDRCNSIYHVQFYIPKADFEGNFDIEFGDNQTVHSFEAQSLAGVCHGVNNSGLLWTYTVLGEDTEDATTASTDSQNSQE